MATTGSPKWQLKSVATGAAASPANQSGPKTEEPKVAQVERPTAAASTYPQDLFERWVLFMDTLRERADNMIEHEMIKYY